MNLPLDNDLPSDIRAYDPQQEQWARERAESLKRIEKLSVGNRFRLMFGQTLLPEVDPPNTRATFPRR